MNPSTCRNCTHFHQHYVIDDQCACPVNCGHCNYPRLKERTPDTPSCKHFSPKTAPDSLPDRAGIIQFLTVEVVKRIMELPLPPEMGACGEE